MEQLQKITNTAAAAPLIALLLPPNAVAAPPASQTLSTPISASWKAVDGLNSLESNNKFVSFNDSAHLAMINDPSRTPLFEKAIINRLQSSSTQGNGGNPGTQVVLDLGTGPYAYFAIVAAKHGAGKVYAIEASKEAAASARTAVQKAGYDDKITILEGFSTDITLPDGIKADFAIAEIVGSVASEEGVIATILDAHERLLKNPNDATSWIPNRIQTFAAPASYSLHNLFKPPAFDWTKLNGEPVRFNCRDEGLQLLSEPVLVEDISFPDMIEFGNKGRLSKEQRRISFTVDGKRIDENVQKFNDEYTRGRVPDADNLAYVAAHSVSGIALWPRLLLDNDVQINSRHYPDGAHQRSHWQTVLPIMSPEPVAVNGGDEIIVNFEFDISSEVTTPPSYKISGNVVSK